MKIKARLTARGDQDALKLFKETESPTASRQSQRLLWHTAAQLELDIEDSAKR